MHTCVWLLLLTFNMQHSQQCACGSLHHSTTTGPQQSMLVYTYICRLHSVNSHSKCQRQHHGLACLPVATLSLSHVLPHIRCGAATNKRGTYISSQYSIHVCVCLFVFVCVLCKGYLAHYNCSWLAGSRQHATCSHSHSASFHWGVILNLSSHLTQL